MNLKFSVGGQCEMFVSKEVKIQGAIGPCVSLKKSGPMISETQLGQSGTNLWYVGGMVIVLNLG